jgi:hypothetical protein
MQYLVGFGGIILGFGMIYFSKWIVDHTMRIDFFERNIGGGGTYSAMKLFGLIVICFGIYVLFGGLGI